MSYSLVYYVEEILDGEPIFSESVVPANWVKDGRMYWSNTIHAVKDANNRVEINPKWPSYEVTKVRVSGDRDLCVLCQNGAFSMSETEASSSKVRHTPNVPTPMPIPPPPLSPPIVKKRGKGRPTPNIPTQLSPSMSQKSGTGKRLVAMDSESEPEDISPVAHSTFCPQPSSSVSPSVSFCVDNLRKSPRLAHRQTADRPSESRLEPPSKKRLVSSVHDHTTSSSIGASSRIGASSSIGVERYPLASEDFQKRVVKKLLDLEVYLKENRKIMERMLMGDGRVTAHGNEITTVKRCTTVDQLMELEEKIVNSEQCFQDLVKQLQKVGGKGMRNCICRTMLHITTYEVMGKFNWTGRCGKKKFDGLKLFKAIASSVLHQYPNSTEQDVKSSFQLVLKDAPFRCKTTPDVQPTDMG